MFGEVQGIVHDPQHRPIQGAHITLKSRTSALEQMTDTDANGAFHLLTVPIGDYTITISQSGFEAVSQNITLASSTSPILHYELAIGTVKQAVLIHTDRDVANVDSVTPTTLIDRQMIEQTPGADRTDSTAMITDYVPGAYMTHDMLHMRGGHQVSWLIDGVEIPNTKIAVNVGPQIDPKDIDYLETQRGSYNADVGDRTYGVFNVLPKTGFEFNGEGNISATFGNFLQSDAQVSYGNHSDKAAYYLSVNGNRSDYGLSTPTGVVIHDASNGYGGFGSFIDNKTAKDQLRLVGQARKDYFQIPYDPNATDYQNGLSGGALTGLYPSIGLRDGEHETDALGVFTWSHTFNATTVLEASPLYHYNSNNYVSNPNDYGPNLGATGPEIVPDATSSNQSSNYAGGEATISTIFARNNIQAGLFSYGEHDTQTADVSGIAPSKASASGGVIEEYLSDNYKITPWLTVIGGVRQSYFTGSSFSEDYTFPRVGLAFQVPKLNWVFRGFYGRFYQPPPLLTLSAEITQFAVDNGITFEPLHGERDEEHQFGVQIPYKGWMLDADNFKTRVNNFLDHNNIGNSSLYYPLTTQGALIRGWELTLRSPRLWRRGQFHLSYSNQIGEQIGPITGGPGCYPITAPQCAVAPGYSPLDHDQRNTLNVGFNGTLPWRMYASTNVYYGSGFSNGDPYPASPYPGDYLPQHTTFDLAVGKTFGENTTVSVNALNVANRRVLLDNSLTFGGFHYNDPRQIYAEVKFHFHL